MPETDAIISIKTLRGTIELREGERFIDAGLFIELHDEVKRTDRFRKTVILELKTEKETILHPFRKAIKPGKRGKLNRKVNRELKAEALASGRALNCELRLDENCTGTFFPSWAHSRRRGQWRDKQDSLQTVIACIPCHTTAQNKGNEENEIIINRAREARETEPIYTA